MRQKPFSFPTIPTILLLIFSLGFGWVVGTLLPAAFAQTGGAVTACVGANSNGSNLTLGGRALKPTDIMRYSSSGTCNAGETVLTLSNSAEPTRTLLVSPVGTPLENGAGLSQSLQNVVNSSNPPSATNPYLIKVAAGIYDMGSTPLVLPAYLTLEGAGEKLTVISSSVTITTGFPLDSGSLVMTSNTELRLLQISNSITDTNAGSDRAAVTVLPGAINVKIRNVTGNALAGTGDTNVAGLYNRGILLVYDSNFAGEGNLNGYGLRNDAGVVTASNSIFQGLSGGGRGRGIYNETGTLTLFDNQVFAIGGVAYGLENTAFSTLTMRNSSVQTIAGTGVRNINSNGTIQGSNINGNYEAISLEGGTLNIDNSKLSSSSVSLTTFSGVAYIRSSHFDSSVPLSNNGGTITCAYSYKQNYMQLSSNCN